ncbi:MAG: arylsulfatase [Thermoguttaceae bacterium]
MRSTLICLALLGIAARCQAQPGAGAVTERQPNILILLADDLGFSDLGCYGAEAIDTPNLVGMAKNGLRFTQFYSAGRGCPSRASLLTGLYAHQTGVGQLLVDYQSPGYRGNLNDRCATIAERLGSAGYQTFLAGKWALTLHVDERAPQYDWPRQRGFDHFFGTLLGAGDYFNPATLARGNELVGQKENSDFYYTEAIAEESVSMLDKAVANPSPFFMVVSLTAPHWPLHARPLLIDAYRGRFEMGWDELREKKYARMVDMGIVHRYWKLSARDPRVLSWFDVPFKEWHQRRMEVYAAQVEAMDQAVGRILDKVRQLGREQNTLVMFLSDNGASGEEILAGAAGAEFAAKTLKGVAIQTGNDPQIMPGDATTCQSYGVPWANASNTPFRSYKGSCYEGGIAVPLIVRWPAVIRPSLATGDMTREIGHVIDVAATCYDVAGVPYGQLHEGRRVQPLEGTSLLAAFLGKAMPLRPLFFEFEGNRAVRYGKWKLVASNGASWELYDMLADRTETTDVAGGNAAVVEKMASLYDAWAARVGVQPWLAGE